MNTDIPDTADASGIYMWDWAPSDPVKYAFWKEGYRTVENQMLGPGLHRVELLEDKE